MLVRKIIETKAIDGVVSVTPEDTVTAAAQLLASKRIGAVIVSRDGRSVDGILSERDIVRAIGTMGPDCLGGPVSALMTRTVMSCGPDDAVNAVMGRMSEGRFRHMPVIEDGVLIGVISIGDVVKARIDEIQSENEALTGMIANNW